MGLLDNDELSGVTAQDGVAISLDWRLNVDNNFAPLSLCTSPSTYRECRIAWAFNNRGSTDGEDKQWLVLKGFRGGLYVPYLKLDATTVSYTADSGTNSGSPVNIAAAKLDFGGANTPVEVRNLVIDNIAFESDNAARPAVSGVAVTRGYFADSTLEPDGTTPIPAGSNTGFMGLQISGVPNAASINAAMVRIYGTITLFPCLAENPSC